MASMHSAQCRLCQHACSWQSRGPAHLLCARVLIVQHVEWPVPTPEVDFPIALALQAQALLSSSSRVLDARRLIRCQDARMHHSCSPPQPGTTMGMCTAELGSFQANWLKLKTVPQQGPGHTSSSCSCQVPPGTLLPWQAAPDSGAGLAAGEPPVPGGTCTAAQVLTVPSSSHHSFLPRGSQASTGSPGLSANWRMGTLVRAMNSRAPKLSLMFFTTFRELVMPCAQRPGQLSSTRRRRTAPVLVCSVLQLLGLSCAMCDLTKHPWACCKHASSSLVQLATGIHNHAMLRF